MEVGIWTIVAILIVGFGAMWYRLGRIEGLLDAHFREHLKLEETLREVVEEHLKKGDKK